MGRHGTGRKAVTRRLLPKSIKALHALEASGASLDWWLQRWALEHSINLEKEQED